MRLSFILITAGMLTMNFPAQCQLISWDNTYNIQDNSVGYSVIQSMDGNFIVGGGGYEPMVVYSTIAKIDSLGNLLWSMEDYGEGIHSVIENSDSTLTVAYQADWYLISSSAAIMKMTKTGNIIWNKTFPVTGYYGKPLKLLPDPLCKSYLLASGDSDIVRKYRLMNLDSTGNILWEKIFFDGNLPFQPADMNMIRDDSTLTLFGNSGNDEVFLIKTNLGGDTLCTRTYAFPGSELIDLVDTDSNYYFVLIHNSDMVIMKTDNNGNFLIEEQYSIYPYTIPSAACASSSGNLIVVGNTYSTSSEKRVFTAKFDAYCDTMWTTVSDKYWPFYDPTVFDVTGTRDKGFIFTGRMGDNFWLVKNDSLGTGIVYAEISESENLIGVYPNPATNTVFVKKTDDTKVTIMNSMGQEILVTTSSTIDVSSFSPGVYIILVDGKRGLVVKQ